MYEYRATVVSVYDGDTFRADTDLGFRVTLRALDFRLLGINAPELRGGADVGPGIAARDALRGLILHQAVTIQSARDKQEKFGRWLATVFVTVAGAPVNANEWMVARGFAVPYLVG